VCAHAVSVSLKSVNGVNSVDVSLNQGLATVTLKPGNTVTMEQLQRAITKNGFTTKQSNIVVTGTLLSDNGKVTLRVSGSNETFALVPQNQQAQDFSHLNGKTVTVEGVIPEGKKGTRPDTIAVHSITGA
jgi:copper chaperone CopZ